MRITKRKFWMEAEICVVPTVRQYRVTLMNCLGISDNQRMFRFCGVNILFSDAHSVF